MSSVYPMNNANDSNASAGDTITQADKTPERAVYLSPFVTISRGKRNANEEFKLRKCSGGSFHTSPEATGIQAGGAYFDKLLSDEIERMRELCTQWANYKDEEHPPPDVCDMINVAIGQGNLLITKKMEQFRQLIDNNVKGCQGPSVTCADLHVFWDMVLIQVSNVIKRFDNLETMRSKEWEDIQHVEKRNTPNVKPIKPNPRRVMPHRKAKTAASALSLAMREARKKKKKNVQVDENKECDNACFTFTINSPPKSSTNVLDSGKGRRVQSPGFASVASPNSEKITPAKSILKITTPVSSMIKVKNVSFKEDVAEVMILEHRIEENDAMKTPEDQKIARQRSRKCTPSLPVSSPRRSARLRMKNLSNANNII